MFKSRFILYLIHCNLCVFKRGGIYLRFILICISFIFSANQITYAEEPDGYCDGHPIKIEHVGDGEKYTLTKDNNYQTSLSASLLVVRFLDNPTATAPGGNLYFPMSISAPFPEILTANASFSILAPSPISKICGPFTHAVTICFSKLEGVTAYYSKSACELYSSNSSSTTSSLDSSQNSSSSSSCPMTLAEAEAWAEAWASAYAHAYAECCGSWAEAEAWSWAYAYASSEAYAWAYAWAYSYAWSYACDPYAWAEARASATAWVAVGASATAGAYATA